MKQVRGRSLVLAALVAAFTLGVRDAGAHDYDVFYQSPGGETVAGVRCGTPVPTAAEAEAAERGVDHWRAQHPGDSELASIITIPVAVHVVRSSSGAWDVTDQQITQQIAVLNSAFAGTNLRFYLAGVDRTNNSAWSQHLPGTSAESQMKSALAVSPATTLNFYICNLADSVLGYSSFPASYPETSYMHGVVVLYSTLPGGSAAPYDLGDTGIHEAGHFVGLYHTFQGSCGVNGDYVTDTPSESVAAYGCPLGRDSCTGSGFDPIQNFMDYTDDACMDRFTSGQSARIDAQMSAYRPAMVASGSGLSADVGLAGVEGGAGGFRLAQNVPNPVHGRSTIAFNLPDASPASLVIYDATGRRVITLVQGFLHAGSHEVSVDDAGMSAGFYFYRLIAGDRVATMRMLVAP